MNVSPEQLTALVSTDRLAEARAHNRHARLRTARRLEQRAAAATRRARLARLAVQ